MKHIMLAILLVAFFVPSMVSAEYRGRGQVRPPIQEDRAAQEGVRDARRAVGPEAVEPGFAEPGGYYAPYEDEGYRRDPLMEGEVEKHMDDPGEVEEIENLQNMEQEPDIG